MESLPRIQGNLDGSTRVMTSGKLSKIAIFAKQKSKDFSGTKIAIGDGVVKTLEMKQNLKGLS